MNTMIKVFLAGLALSLFCTACGSEPAVISHMAADKAEAKTIMSEKAAVYTPVKDASYAHHPFLAYFNGQFYAAFSLGKTNEDDLGQSVALCRSADGLNWSDPEIVVTPADLGDEIGVCYPTGFYSDGKQLVLYVGFFRYDPATTESGRRPMTDSSHLDTSCYALTTQDGTHFSDPIDLNMAFIGNHGPFVTKTGRLILCGNIAFPYSDDSSGTGSFTMTGIYGDTFGQSTVTDDSASIHIVAEHMGWDPALPCEGSCIQLKNGTIRMFLRSNIGVLYVTESTDIGESWSDPVPTEFVSDGSKFYAGKLPDGRYYMICNPVNNGYRIPLTLYTSKDGANFDKAYVVSSELYEQHFQGLFKGGICAYPHAIVEGDFIYVIYSKHKEAIEVARIPLSELK